MKFPVARSLTLAMIFVPVALAACGSTSTTTSGGTTPSAASSSPSPSASASQGTPLVGTATAMVAGKSEAILVDAKGMTLYYRTSDTATSVTCSGSCATIWPPVLLELGTPTAAASIIASVTVVDGANGKQLVYKGRPLYRYSKDTAAGDTKGHGIGGVWFVVTV